MTPRMKLLWLALPAFTFGMLLASVKSEVTQGSGVRQLVKSAKLSQSTAQALETLEVPSAIVLPTKTFYFVATSLRDGLESVYSNEVSATNAYPTLAWDGVTNVIGYKIYRGRESGIYTNTWTTGTNTQFTVPRPQPPTNMVITITSSKLTNIQYRASSSGAWTLLNATNLTATNPAWGNFREWRGLGRTTASPKTLSITRRFQ